MHLLFTCVAGTNGSSKKGLTKSYYALVAAGCFRKREVLAVHRRVISDRIVALT